MLPIELAVRNYGMNITPEVRKLIEKSDYAIEVAETFFNQDYTVGDNEK